MTVVDKPVRTAEGVLRAVQDLTPTIAARAAEIEAARRVPADLLGDLDRHRLLPDAAAVEPRRGRIGPVDRHAYPRDARHRRCVGGLDRRHRRRGLARSGRPAPGELRRHRGHRTRDHRRRRVPACRHCRSRRRGLPGDGPVELRQRLRARHLDLRQLHRARRRPRGGRAAPDAHRRVLPQRSHHRGHLARVGPAWHGQPPLPRRRRVRTGRAHPRCNGGSAVPGRAHRPSPVALRPRAADGEHRPRHRPRRARRHRGAGQAARCR